MTITLIRTVKSLISTPFFGAASSPMMHIIHFRCTFHCFSVCISIGSATSECLDEQEEEEKTVEMKLPISREGKTTKREKREFVTADKYRAISIEAERKLAEAKELIPTIPCIVRH